MKTSFPFVYLSVALASMAFAVHAANPVPFRPPAVPLVTSDPYLSIWSDADRLTDDTTRHWTGSPQPLVSLISIDGKSYRLMGADPSGVPAMPQSGLKVTPTRSIYDFDDGHVHVTLIFMTPALPGRLDILARPLTYLTWDVRSVDGKTHAVKIYDSTSSLLAVNDPTEDVTCTRGTAGPLTALKCGCVDQTLFEPQGDAVRIDWGYAYASARADQSTSCIGESDLLQKSFLDDGTLPASDEAASPATTHLQPVMAFAFDLGPVGSATVSRHLMIAYDELYEIAFSNRKLLPYWKRNGATASDLLQSAESDYAGLIPQCESFDQRLMADLEHVGGPQYANIAALAYRQVLAATGLAADANKQPLLFTKENTSNGDIATVDVLFPTSPMFLLLSPTLAKASAVPVLAYAASDRWKFPNSPHDLGKYPVAYSSGRPGEAMPVEESGNMLILCDAIARADHGADFVAPWWPQLTQWARFLETYGLDPENQLCTDDFMGHLAHNSNLSIKAIVALAAYGDLCRWRGDMDNAKKYFALARADARHWMKAADDGDHYRLAYDKPGTWSEKYNLVWDKILGLHVFPPEVENKELAYYKSKLTPYGVPLDSRTKLVDVDHTFFTATLSGKRSDFEAMILPFYNYLTRTPAHFPIVDTYKSDKLDSHGFHARSVVGGIFIRMLADPQIWEKWADADPAKPGPWAAIPPLPILSVLLPASPKKPFVWRYTLQQPAPDWTGATFDDSAWMQGRSLPGKPKTDPRNPKKILPVNVWSRVKFTLPDVLPPHLEWILGGSSTAGEIYLNGIRAGIVSGHDGAEPQEISPPAQDLLQPGAQIVIAVHSFGKKGALGDISLGTVSTP